MNEHNSVKILIAEDSRTQAEQLRFLLEQHGYQVTVMGDGRQALQAAIAEKPALVISDIVMPEMDGYELCKAIKSNEILKEIPVILVTSLSDSLDVILGLECGADNFICKPYDGDYLVSRIHHLLINLELRKVQKMQLGVEIEINGQMHFITAERQQILDLLISTYEQAVHVNKELMQRDKELMDGNKMLNGLYRIADGLNRADSELAVVETALELMLELPEIQAGWIWLRDGESGFRLAAARNLPTALGELPDAFDGYCTCQRKLLGGELEKAVNIIECERLTKAIDKKQGRYHHACVPLLASGDYALGVMELIGQGESLIDETVLKILFGIGNQVAVALDRSRLHEHLEQLVEERTAKLVAEVAERIRVQEEQARLVAIIEATPDLVGTAETDGHLLYLNPAGRRMLGFAPEVDLSTVNFFETHPAWAEQMLRNEAIPYAIEHGTWSGETALLGSDGREIPVLQVIIAHKDSGRDRAYLSTIIRDIAKRKLAEASILRLNETLENKVVARTVDLELALQAAEVANQAKSAFLATMSHEIRTPMNGVIGMIDVLHQSSLKGYQVEMVDLIRESAYSLLGIIDDILDFSKIEAGKLELENAPTSVADAVEKTCAMLDHLARKKTVVLTLFTDPTIPAEVLSDAERLRQILINLVSNAIKFSSGREQEGRVSIRAVLSEHSPDRVVVEICIIDNGIGMNEETLSELFTSFTQADASTTRRFGGTGLGLSIAHHLVELMGGEIAVQSTPGSGSIFTVRLPFVPLPGKADADAAKSPVTGLSCLVVGGSQGLSDDIATYLTHGGATVKRALDLAAAQEQGAAGSSGLWVWVIDAVDAPPPLDELRAITRTHPEQEIRFVVIKRGLRRKPRLEDANVALVDGNVLTRWAVLKSVAIAAGRAHEENAMPLPGMTETAFSTPSRTAALRQGRLILVAEDNETNQKVIQRQLALLGFAVDVADDGRQALEHWQSCDYALLLTDLHMPEMDGYDLATAIRAEEKDFRRIPIVALSATALKGEAERCRAAGMDDYLSKPVQLAHLKAMLEKWLPSADETRPDSPATPSPQPTVAETVDVSVLKRLVGNDPAVIHDFLHDFRISATQIAADLKIAYAAGHSAQVGALAHKLKSSARSVGALTLGEVCDKIEQAGKVNQIELLAELLPCFETEMAAVDEYLDAL